MSNTADTHCIVVVTDKNNAEIPLSHLSTHQKLWFQFSDLAVHCIFAIATFLEGNENETKYKHISKNGKKYSMPRVPKEAVKQRLVLIGVSKYNT